MNANIKKATEAAIVACANKAAKADTTALDAMQLTQAAINAANTLVGIEENERRKG